VVIGAAAGMLACVILVASWLPAWRASRTAPIEALRYE
jgi:ABC-type lipoprotein release transport system permease subunit